MFADEDQISYTHTYLATRNAWIVARQDRNIATYKLVHDINDDVLSCSRCNKVT